MASREKRALINMFTASHSTSVIDHTTNKSRNKNLIKVQTKHKVFQCSATLGFERSFQLSLKLEENWAFHEVKCSTRVNL